MTGDELAVLDHGLEVRDGGGSLDGVGRGGTFGGVNNDLHIFFLYGIKLVTRTCASGEKMKERIKWIG